MTDLLSIALTGVKAYSRGLEVVGDNVANASTAGYVRRTATYTEIIPGRSGPYEIDPRGGNGVLLTGIGRAADLLRTDTLRRAEGDVAALDTADTWMSNVQATLQGASALDDPMTQFFASASALVNDPANLAVRSAFLQRAQTLADRFNSIGTALDRVQSDIAAQAQTDVAKFNTLAQGLAAVNGQLRRSSPDTGTSAALADERDKLLAAMATYTTIDVHLDERGQAQVRIPDGGGPLVVDADHSRQLRVVDAPGGGYALRVGPPGSDVPATLVSGSIAGLSAAAQSAGQAKTAIDALATRVGTEINATQARGVDLNGSPGAPLFVLARPVATAAGANGGTARINATIADGAVAGAMQLTFDGVAGQWTLARADLGASVTGGLPLTLDGVTVDGSGTPRNGDLFDVRMQAGANGIALRPVSAQEVAAAPQFLAEAGGGNLGDGRVTVTGGPALMPPATPPYTIAALAGGVLEMRDALGMLMATGPAGSPLAGDGFTAQVNGTPAEGDTFAVRPTGAGSSANGNALALLALKNAPGPSGTYGDQQDQMLTNVSVPLSEVQARQTVAVAYRDQAAQALQDSSGVDLNTEAAEMLRLQQAYSANARVIQAARETFDTILNAAR
jgi:flagellar hook-associated protein 1 FlgK